jgi:hypothetical protein
MNRTALFISKNLANISTNISTANTVEIVKTSSIIDNPNLQMIYYIIIGIVFTLSILAILKYRKKKPVEQTHNQFVEQVVKQWKEEEKNYSAKEMYKVYNISKMKNWLDFKTMKYKLTSALHPLSSVMINMQLSNGTIYQFIAEVKNGGFSFDKGFYLIDDNIKQWNVSSKIFMFSYHEELCFPIKTSINIAEVKKSLFQSNEVELETAVNPVSLDAFMRSSVIEKLLKGDAIEDGLRFIKTMSIIILIICCVILLLCFKSAKLLG